MLKIGDFARLARVSVKTLHYYGRIGLLKPVWTDRFTSYRYYSLDQLPRLNRILALKDLGFSLDQIAQLLTEELPVEEMRGMFRLKQAELRHKLELEQARLALVESRLRQIEAEDMPVLVDVVLKPVPAQWVLSVRVVVATGAALPAAVQLWQTELTEWMARQGQHRCGPWMVIYHNPVDLEAEIDFELAVPVPAPTTALPPTGVSERPNPIRVSYLPGHALVASLVQTGSYQQILTADLALFRWIEANAYRLSGPARLVYLEDEGGQQPVPPVVEVQFPVESLSAIRANYLRNHAEEAMEPKLIVKPAFTVVGMKYQGKNQNNELPGLWDRFIPRINEIQNVSNPRVSYGLCGAAEGEAADGEFEYIAGYEVTDASQVPAGMVARFVPERQYAVFEHRGAQTDLRETYDYIFNSWLPQSGYRVASPQDFEVYDDAVFHGFAPDSIMYIYVPVEKV